MFPHFVRQRTGAQGIGWLVGRQSKGNVFYLQRLHRQDGEGVNTGRTEKCKESHRATAADAGCLGCWRLE